MENSFTSFVTQLKNRKVIRVAITYIVVAFVVMQVGDASFEALQVPDWVHSVVVVFLLLGFPIALVLAWAYELTPEGIRRERVDVDPDTDTAAAIDPSPSIAVLPFDDMSQTQDQTYFCEGIAEEILNALCKIENLRVASRVASFRFGSKGADIEEIGQRLKVNTVLEGSVRKSGDRVRITAQLVKTADGFHLWSRQYDRTMDDIFSLQEEIASSIASALSLTLKKRADHGQQVDSEAYDYFLRGLSYFARHTTQDTVYARQMFNQAIRISPEFGRAWAGLAYTYGFEYMYFNATDINLGEAKRTSAKALELDPELAEAHVAAGIAHCMCQEYSDAEEEFEKAIALDPKNFEAWYFFGRAKVHEGDLERAIGLFERSAQVRPEDYQSLLLQAQLYVSLGDKTKAMEVTRQGMERVRAVLDLNPDDNRAWNLGAFALQRLGKKEEAARWMETSISKAPMDSIAQYNAACFYALAGEAERSLDCLQNCLIKVGNISREWLEHDSDLDSLRDNPRYADIIASFPD
jgi:TolB-like protein/Flp pilus assembly protein TadD